MSDYLKNLPDGLVRNRDQMVQELEKRERMQAQQAMQAQQGQALAAAGSEPPAPGQMM